jgi:hypothetical protein
MASNGSSFSRSSAGQRLPKKVLEIRRSQLFVLYNIAVLALGLHATKEYIKKYCVDYEHELYYGSRHYFDPGHTLTFIKSILKIKEQLVKESELIKLNIIEDSEFLQKISSEVKESEGSSSGSGSVDLLDIKDL